MAVLRFYRHTTVLHRIDSVRVLCLEMNQMSQRHSLKQMTGFVALLAMFGATVFIACGSLGTPTEPTTLNTVSISQPDSVGQLSVPITMFILVDDIDEALGELLRYGDHHPEGMLPANIIPVVATN